MCARTVPNEFGIFHRHVLCNMSAKEREVATTSLAEFNLHKTFWKSVLNLRCHVPFVIRLR